jgi:hypothetical protein
MQAPVPCRRSGHAKVFCFFFSKKKFLLPYLHPGALGFIPHPPAVEFTFVCGGGFFTTVPSCVVPCEVHSQYPPTGIFVAHISFSVWHMLANAGPLAKIAATATNTLNRMAYPFVRKILHRSMFRLFRKERSWRPGGLEGVGLKPTLQSF